MASEKEVREILSTETLRLTALPNVVGLGIVPVEEAASEAALAVYVCSKVPEETLNPGEAVPRFIERMVDGSPVRVRTKVIEVGDFKF